VFLLWAIGACLGGLGLLSTLVTARQAGLLLVATLGGGFVAVYRLRYDEFAVIRNGIVLRLYDAPLLRAAMFAVFVELVLVACAVWGAIGLKTDDWGLTVHRQRAIEICVVLAPATIAAFQLLGVNKRAWRLAGMEDFVRLAVAVGLSTVGGYVLHAMFFRESGLASTFGIYGMLKAILATGARGSYRLLSGIRDRSRSEGPPVVIYGAGKGGIVALREARENGDLGMVPVAFLDDAPERVGTYVNGVEVVGPLEVLGDLVRVHSGLTLIVSTNKIGPERLRDAVRVCRVSGVRMLRMELGFRELLPTTEAAGEEERGVRRGAGSEGRPRG
jgi:FlaA1/EpsC-like NDP-sugar epimerase